jgi:2-keto-4-pentenoate hydratase/2-oxohepta-3-ene-1,7-dioic acid hydratase in catechol pathway
MRLGTVRIRGTAPRLVGLTAADSAHLIDINEAGIDLGLIYGEAPRTLVELLELGDYGQSFLADLGKKVEDRGDLASAPWAFSLAEVEFLAPVPKPGKVILIGGNRKVSGEPLDPGIQDVWPRPQFFEKAPTSVTGHNATVDAWNVFRPVQIEGEVCVIFGRRARSVAAADAWSYVAGVALLNDMSAGRFGLQDGVVLMINRGPGKDPEEMITRNMSRAKIPDGYCPIGPWMVPVGDLDVPFEDVEVTTIVGPNVVQKGVIADYGFSAEECIEEVTRWVTFEPGDVLSLGCFANLPDFPLRNVDAAAEGRRKLVVTSPQLGELVTHVNLVD